MKTDKGHFGITFDNGYTLSIFNGFGSYSDNHFKTDLLKQDDMLGIESQTCEIAIIYEGELVTQNHIDCGDSVKGYITPNELVDIMKMVSELGDSNE